MELSEVIKKLYDHGPELAPQDAASRKFSLETIRALLAKLGSPQSAFPSVLIAGTNGKGSTAATLAAICAAAGLRTGLYTSPHLVRVNERIRISDGSGAALASVSDEAFAHAFTRMDAVADAMVEHGALPHAPSFFERMTAVAFLVFAEARLDVAVLEVGLGGRLDATNVVEPVVCVITDIAMDHMEYLGGTLREIAGEKAGILRTDGVLVTLSQHPEANAAIGARAVELNVRGVDAARCLPPQTARSAGVPHPSAMTPRTDGPPGIVEVDRWRNRYPLVVDGAVLQVDSPLGGRHQQRNLALAIATALELRANHLSAQPKFAALTNAAIERGITATEWPGRLEWVAAQQTQIPFGNDKERQGPGTRDQGSGSETRIAPVLLDVAHNPAGAWTLRAAIAELDEARPRTLVFSCLADKQLREMAQVLFPLFDARGGDPLRAHDHIVVAAMANPRAASIDDLLAVARALDVHVHAAPHVAAAFHQARQITPADGVIVATGSVFLVGEVRELAMGAPVTHGAEAVG